MSASQPILEVFSDYVCPWCYFCTGRIERLRAETGVVIKWVAHPLHPETPPQGLSLAELFADRQADIPAMMARLKAAANAEGLPLGERDMTYNSRRAQELGKWAEEQGAGPAFHAAAFRAYFAEGLNLYEPEVLAELARRAGLDQDQALEVVRSGSHAPAVDADWAYSRQMEVMAVPTFLMDGRRLVGAHSFVELKRLVEAPLGNPITL